MAGALKFWNGEKDIVIGAGGISSISVATEDTLGGVKSGGDVTIDADGLISVADGAIGTSNIVNKAVSRAKLGNDALYSPMLYSDSRNITVNDIGYTLSCPWNTSATFTLSQEVSSTIPTGAEIAFCRMGISDIDVLIVGDGVRFAITGETSLLKNATARISDTFGMIALKKYTNDTTNGDGWLITGNVEVVS